MKKVCIIDSGVGGLSVLASCIKRCSANYIYIADNLHLPYGNKSREQLKSYIDSIINDYVPSDVDVVIIACNTATSVLLTELKKSYPYTFLGIAPAVDMAISEGKKNILTIATCNTIEQYKGSYDRKNIRYMANYDLATYIENHFDNVELLKSQIQKIKDSYKNTVLDGIVLGCTHYSLIKEIFEEVFGNDVAIYDQNNAISRNLEQILSYKHSTSNNTECSISIYLTKNCGEETAKYSKILKKMMKNDN